MDSATVVPAHLAKPLSLEPFRASLLNPARVGDPRAVRTIARPYPDPQSRRTAWEGDGLVQVMPTDALYLHEYTTGGLTVRGLVGALRLTHRAGAGEEEGLLPHERIHPHQALDLAAKMEAIALNPAPILLSMRPRSAYRALLAVVSTGTPLSVFTDRYGQHHRIWAVPPGALEHELRAEVAATSCMVADGHHRYAAYLQLAERHPGTGWDLGLAMLVDQNDTPFFLGPIHRILRGTVLANLIDRARRLDVDAHLCGRQAAVDTLPHGRIVATDGREWVSLTPPQDSGKLLVEWLHQELVPDLPPDAITYHHTLDDALRTTTTHDTAIILPAPSYAAVATVVTAGRLLPEKATSFQPKPTLGVIMRQIQH